MTAAALARLKAEEVHLEERLALERARTGLLNFTRFTKPEYRVNWHHRLIARHLNAVVEGKIKRLIINMPPRYGKTEALRRLAAFYMGRNPDAEVISASYSQHLATLSSKAVQRIIDSAAYRQLFPGTQLTRAGIKGEDDVFVRKASTFEVVNRKGRYTGVGVSSSVTGTGGDLVIIDDPHKDRAEADSPTLRAHVQDWWGGTIYHRLESGAAVIVCHTRWHEEDLTGHLLTHAAANPKAEQWVVLRLPAQAEEPLHPDDPRRPGEFLWTGKYPADEMEQKKATMPVRDWAGQFQQRPAPAEGTIINKTWWQFWRELPAKFDMVGVGVDLAFADTSDFCALQVWGRAGAQYYLLDQVHARIGYLEQKGAVVHLDRKHPAIKAFWIEDAATARPLIADLKRNVGRLIPVRPEKSKVARLEAIAHLIKAGDCHLPDPRMPGMGWVEGFMSELSTFPSAAHDDQVDACSLALSQLERKKTAKPIAPLEIMKNRPLGLPF